MHAALTLLERVPNILVFLTALTVVSECCSITGLFDGLSDQTVRLARGRVFTTWLLTMGMAVLVTAFLSLDTTAVLMTSAGVAVARRLGRSVIAFVFPVLWIANMGSMWLPVSNLTTLLARDVLPHPNALGYLTESWPVALTTTVVPLLTGAIMFRRDLRGRVAVSPQENAPLPPEGRLARRGVAACVVAMSAGMLVIEPAVGASVTAIACWLIVRWQLPQRRGDIRLPWSSLGITTLLFGVVAAIHGLGLLDGLVSRLHSSPPWALALTAGVGADAINNLPAYLAFEPAAHGDVTRILALLIGVNVLSSLTWWGSVATLLWRDRIRRAGENVSVRAYLYRTGIATALCATSALLVLSLTH